MYQTLDQTYNLSRFPNYFGAFMGVEYIHYLLPKNHAFSPSAQQIEQLVAALYRGNWLCSPDSEDFAKLDFDSVNSTFVFAKETGVFRQEDSSEACQSVPYPLQASWLTEQMEGDLRLVWPIYDFDHCRNLRYPFNKFEGISNRYYEVNLQLSKDYVHRSSEILDPLPSTSCNCGEELEYWPEEDPLDSPRIRKNCPQCQKLFLPGKQRTTCRDGWTGKEKRIEGGATYCFALAIDCSKALPKSEAKTEITIHKDLRILVEKTLGIQTYELHDVY